MKEKPEGPAPVDLCLEVLRRLDRAGVLEELMLVGSWCTHFYNQHFAGKATLSALRTRDMDFLVRRPPRFKVKVQIADLLKDLGFLPDLHPEGTVSMMHPDLIIDFLVAERGTGAERRIPVDALGIRAQPLRFLDFLSRDTIVVNVQGLDLRLPHPASFALHKLIVSSRRPKPEKKEKDLKQGLELIDVLIRLGKTDELRERFQGMPAGWKKTISAVLNGAGRADIATTLRP
jgi:hypothetical protein